MAEQESGLGSSEHYGDEMEVDSAVLGPLISPYPPTGTVSVSQQCTEGATSLQATSPTTLSWSRSQRLCLFNKKLSGSLAEQICSTMNCLKRYEVNEPIGCAMLLSSDGTPESPGDLTSVVTDMEAISRALEVGGWDIICKTSKLHSLTLREQLSDLGKEKQLRSLGRQTRDLEDYSVFMLYYTGHGTADGVVLNDGKLVHYQDIVNKVAEVPCLSEKPKLFLFDSCRKKKTDQHERASFVAPKNLHYTRDFENTRRRDQQNSHRSYPPSHTMVCFSAAEDRPSFQDKVEGSFYTLALSHALGQFGKEWSFQEIITQVNGGTKEVARSYNAEQTPNFQSNLEKLLVLNTSFRDDFAERDGDNITTTPLSERQYLSPGNMVIGKGVLVERDMIPKDPRARPAWKSKEQVMSNTRHLGDGVSVFFIYAPNPDNAHKPAIPDDKWELRNRYLMSRLFFDLELHGFHVLSDLHLDNTEPNNWVQWYVTRISHCNFVIFVCSPAFKELFEDCPRVDELTNPKARRLVEYRNAVYAGIANEISKEGRRKFIPVILDNYESQQSVPILFQPGTVYRVPKEDRRIFDFDNRSRDFEKLVCHMAGINRNDLEQVTRVSRVPTLAGPFDKKVDLWSDDLDEEFLKGPPQGYVVSKELPSHQGLVGPPQSHAAWRGQGAEVVEVYHSQHQIGVSAPIASNSRVPPLHVQQPHPQSHQQPHPQQLHLADSQQPSQQPPSIPQRSHQPPYQHLQPRPQPHPQTVLNSLPLTPPNQSIYLWLAKELASWKFIGRHLGLVEGDLERIVSDYQVGGTDEQCYQMLVRWEQRFGGNGCDYRTLGKVLLDSDKNRHLFAEYVERVKSIEKLQ